MSRLSRGKMVFGTAALLINTCVFGAVANSEADGVHRCIPISSIRRTEVVDDQNILFYMNNKKIYNNHLPYRCNGLAFGKAFKYATSQSQLCNVDIISVIQSTTGDVLPGASCGLGMFVPAGPTKKSPKD